MVALRVRPSRRPNPIALAAAFALLFVWLVSSASPAYAHDELLGSDPAAGSTVASLPAELALTFRGAITADEGASQLQVTDASGNQLSGGAPTTQDNVLTQPLSGEASGTVTVLWKVVSRDGHPISGEFTFTVAGAPTPTASPTPTGTATATPTHSGSPAPTTAPVPAEDGSSPVPWIILGVLAVLAAAALAYLLASRARRQQAAASQRAAATGGEASPRSGPSVER